MINSDLQRDEFQGRLNRIKKGGPNMLGQVYVGPAEEPGALTDLKPHFGIMATLLALIVGALGFAGHGRGSAAERHEQCGGQTAVQCGLARVTRSNPFDHGCKRTTAGNCLLLAMPVPLREQQENG